VAEYVDIGGLPLRVCTSEAVAPDTLYLVAAPLELDAEADGPRVAKLSGIGEHKTDG
jgi:hypothetical protein